MDSVRHTKQKGSQMISYLLRTTGAVLIGAAVNNEKFQKKVFGIFKRSPSKFVRTEQWTQENQLFDQQLQALNLRLNDIEYMRGTIDMSNAIFPNEEAGSEDFIKRDGTDVSPEDHDPTTGEILESSPGKE